MVRKIAKMLNITNIFNFFELMIIIIVLFLASLIQFVMHELPCPLCLLQRLGFIFILYGFLLNFRFGTKPIHYSIVIISALFTSFVALRQTALHIVPGSGGYGSPIFGLHLYSWSFIISILIILFTALLLAPTSQYRAAVLYRQKYGRYITDTLFVIVALVILLNLVSVIFECGLRSCPDNPISYELIQKFKSH